MDISIIICTYNRCDSLKAAMDSIFSANLNAGVSVEIIVVDNNSTDATVDVVNSYAGRNSIKTRYVLELNQGLSYARNRGIRESEGNILAFIDDDVLVEKDWINCIVTAFKDSTVLCAGGKIFPLWQTSCPAWLSKELHPYLSLLDLGDDRIKMDKPTIWGANLVFRAFLFEKYGMFDTSLGRTAGKLYGNEEVVLIQKLIENGVGVYYIPEIVVHHCIGSNRMKKSYFRKWFFDTGELEGIKFGYYRHRNLFGIPYYVLKDSFISLGCYVADVIRQPENEFVSEFPVIWKAGFINGRIKFYKSKKLQSNDCTHETTRIIPVIPSPNPDKQDKCVNEGIFCQKTAENTFLLTKDNILVISPAIPRPDMNSGDLRLSSLIKIMAKTYDITFVACNDKPGDDAYISLLERAGITVYSAQSSLWNLLRAKKFTMAILEFYFTAEFYFGRIRLLQPECRVVVDTVDVHYLRLKQKYDLTKDEADFAYYQETRKKELSVYRKADAVITVTRDDAAALLEDSLDVPCEVVPNIHELCLGDTPPESNMLIFVGGFVHDPNVDAVLHFCREILPLIRENRPDVHFTIVGSNPPDEIRALESEAVTVTGFVPSTTPYLHRSCVSVAPLRYGAGMKGKIGEAMAHGVPVVTTSVGAQGMGLTNRKNIMIADSPDCFASIVMELMDDSRLYETIRSNAIQLVDDNFTSQRVAKTMIAAMERICKKPAKRARLHEKIAFIRGYLTQKVKTRLCLN